MSSLTSPLNYLVLIEAVEILPRLFSEVLIPPTVLLELQRQRTPESVRIWAAKPPTWLQGRTPHHVDDSLGLHRGETEAIALVEELHADRLLVDERDAAQVAHGRGIHVVGTLAVLDEAAERGFIDFLAAIARLRQTNFRGPQDIINELLQKHITRKNFP